MLQSDALPTELSPVNCHEKYCVGIIDLWSERTFKLDFSLNAVERHYSKLIPATTSPLNGLYIATMAQIYPEDRGTNYAIREGISIAELLSNDLS